MMSKMLPDDFHWVIARSKCFVPEVFKELESGARDDAEKAQSLVVASEKIRFSVSSPDDKGSRFSVTRVDGELDKERARCVHFQRNRSEIAVLDNALQLRLKATLTLNNAGECRLLVNGEELEQWQFRRLALESLFFGMPDEAL